MDIMPKSSGPNYKLTTKVKFSTRKAKSRARAIKKGGKNLKSKI